MSFPTDQEILEAWEQLQKGRKHRICKVCGVNYERGDGLGRVCSPRCLPEFEAKSKRCIPHCSSSSLTTRIVVFKNGSEHRQQICSLCKRTKYVPKGEKKKRTPIDRIHFESALLTKKYGKSFYTSERWIRLKHSIVEKYGKECMACGAQERICVDHIKPRSKYPDLEWDIGNLQVLCQPCNKGKGAWDETDWRVKK
jgi:5-methylcytosine-specific restriction endonuclease McrA